MRDPVNVKVGQLGIEQNGRSRIANFCRLRFFDDVIGRCGGARLHDSNTLHQSYPYCVLMSLHMLNELLMARNSYIWGSKMQEKSINCLFL